MRPWQHARSSAGKAGDWSDYLALHEFLDISKTASADRRHRLLLHHLDLGGEIAARAFPGREDIAALVEQHVGEDLRRPCHLADWFAACDRALLPRPLPRRVAAGAEGVAALVASRLPAACHPAVRDMARFLFRPAELLDDEPLALAFLMNSAGLAVVRRVFGPPQALPATAGAVMVDHGWIAEALMFASYGRILDLGEVLRCWSREPGAADA